MSYTGNDFVLSYDHRNRTFTFGPNFTEHSYNKSFLQKDIFHERKYFTVKLDNETDSIYYEFTDQEMMAFFAHYINVRNQLLEWDVEL